MKTSTKNPQRARGFTLVEVLISTSIGAALLAAVFSTVLMLGRSSVNLVHYNEMDGQARGCLERFARDVRQASAIEWKSSTEVELTYPGGSPLPVTYALGGADGNSLIRTQNGTSISLVSGIDEFAFVGYTLDGTQITSSVTLENASKLTKQLQLSLTAARSRATVADASNTVLSARFILRNKKLSI